MICLTRTAWEDIKPRLINEYGPSIILIRARGKEVLGFTVRDLHVIAHRYGHDPDIALDFDTEMQEVWFRMRYISTESKNPFKNQ